MSYIEFFFKAITHLLPAIIFEPVYIAGVVGIVISFAPSPRRKSFFLLFGGILLMIAWRTAFHSNIVSKRYFEIILIPFIIFSAYGICNIKDFCCFFRIPENTTLFRLFRILLVCFFITIIVFEINKLLRTDFYRYNILWGMNEYAKAKLTNNKTIVFFNLESEANRIKYYFPFKSSKIVKCDENNLNDIFRIIPGVLFNDNVLFILETSAKKQVTLLSFDELNGLILGKKILQMYTSKHKKKVFSCFSFISELNEKNDPILISGKKTYNISSNDVDLKRGKIIKTDNFIVEGKNSMIFAKDFIHVSSNNRLDLSVTVKNVGENDTTIYVGYAFYDKNKVLIEANCYPADYVNSVLTVESVNSEKAFIIVDKQPQWKKNYSIAMNASNDLSDIPNSNLLDALVTNVEYLHQGKAKIELNKTLGGDIVPGTKIRLHRISGPYIYKGIKALSPGEVYFNQSSIAKYDSYLYYNANAISKGVYYVKPLILSYSTSNNPNSIKIINWSLKY